MERNAMLNMWRELAREWAPLCAVRIIQNGDGSKAFPSHAIWMLRAGESDNFEDVPGAKWYEVSFLADPSILRTDASNQQRIDYFRQQWMMAMISLMDLLTKPNQEHNRKLAEAAAAKESEPRCSCGRWAIGDEHHPSCERARRGRTRGEEGRKQRS